MSQASPSHPIVLQLLFLLFAAALAEQVVVYLHAAGSAHDGGGDLLPAQHYLRFSLGSYLTSAAAPGLTRRLQPIGSALRPAAAAPEPGSHAAV